MEAFIIIWHSKYCDLWPLPSKYSNNHKTNEPKINVTKLDGIKEKKLKQNKKMSKTPICNMRASR